MKPRIDIDHICALARLKLSEEDKAGLRLQMEEIVAWVDKLSELELGEGEDEISSPVFFSLPFRSDDIKDSFSVDLALANSPEKSRDFIKVPKVIEDK